MELSADEDFAVAAAENEEPAARPEEVADAPEAAAGRGRGGRGRGLCLACGSAIDVRMVLWLDNE